MAAYNVTPWTTVNIIRSMLQKAQVGFRHWLELALAHSAESRLRIEFPFVDTDAFFPYCAYNEEWSCPLPPRENRLAVPIEAGEKKFHEDS